MADVTVADVTVTISGGDTWPSSNHIDDANSYNSSNSWASQQTSNTTPTLINAPAYVGIDLGAGNVAVLDGLNVSQGSGSVNSIIAANGISFQYSDDGAAWTEHEKLSLTSTSYAGVGEAVVFASPTPARRYFRFVALANVGGPDNAWGMAEVVYDGTLNPSVGGGGGGGFGGLGTGRGQRGRRRR